MMTTHRPFAGALALGIGLVLLLSGCTPGEAAPSASESATTVETAVPAAAPGDFETVVSPSWAVTGTPVGVPSEAEGFVVSYLDNGDTTLSVVVWDAASGAEVWRDTAVVGGVTPGIVTSARLARSADGGWYVVYQQPTDGPTSVWNYLRVAEIATGNQAHLSEEFSPDTGEIVMFARSAPAECDDGHDICYWGSFVSGRLAAGDMRVDIGTGKAGVDPLAFAPGFSRSLGTDVFSTNNRGSGEAAEMLGVVGDGEVLWEKPFAEIFGNGASSDGGWAWYSPEGAEVIVGTGRVPATQSADNILIYALGAATTAGIDRATGELLWSIPSTPITCAAALISVSYVDDVFPVCRANSGSVSYDIAAGTSVVTNVDVDVLGVELATGEILWTVEAGSDPSLYAESDGTSSFGGYAPWRPLMINGETTLLNALTGQTEALAPNALLSCLSERPGFTALATETGGTANFNSGSNVFGCAADRSARADFAMSPSGLASTATAADGDWWVVSGADGLRGYHSPEATAASEASLG